MSDQSKLAEILCRMQSDYIPEHKAAADDFIKEGFPTDTLFSIIQGFQQPNLVSMFFYVSGKRSEEETLKAWIYLQNRFEAAPDGFVTNSYNPRELSDENRYLLYSARKYLLVSGKFELFRSYLEIIKQKAMPLMQAELCGDKTAPAIVTFYQWLKNFFAVYSPNKVGLGGTSCSQKTYEPSITPEKLHQLFQKMRELVKTFSFDQYIIEAEKVTEDPMYKSYLAYHDADYVAQHKYVGRMLHGQPFFPDVPCPYYEAVDEILKIDDSVSLIWSIRNLLYERADIGLCIEMLDRIENVLLLQQSKDNKTYEAAVISTSFYYYFEQNVYDAGYSVDFCNHVSYRLKKGADVSFYENLLLPYLKKDAFFDIGSRSEARAYMALDVLLTKKSIKAYSFVKELLTSEQSAQLKPPASNHWDFILREFYKSLKKGNYVDRPAYEIGLDWEELCQRIAKMYFLDTLTNHDGICLENGTIPDIMIGEIKRNEHGRVTHAERIIECKKSLYFAGLLEDVLNNETTYKYYDFCDTLEYWILEEDTNFSKGSIADNPKVKCVFANDLLAESWLSNEFKDAIRFLQEELVRRDSRPSSGDEKLDELFNMIDNLIECPPPDIIISSFRQHRGKKRIKPTSVIRQYTMEGNFIKEFESVAAAASEIGLRVDTITNATSGRRNSAGGFLWKKCPVGSTVENIVPPNTALDLEGKAVFQVDHYGEVIATFATIGQAAKSTGVSRRSISDVLKGIQKTAGGFTWVLGDKILDK